MQNRGKTIVIIAMIVFIGLWGTILPIFLFPIGAPKWMIVLVTAVPAIGVVLICFALKRFRESDEGLEDAVDNH